jgi:hypothetical protein
MELGKRRKPETSRRPGNILPHFRVPGSGFRVPGSRFQVPGSGFRVPGSGFRVPGSAVAVAIPGSAVFGFQGGSENTGKAGRRFL